MQLDLVAPFSGPVLPLTAVPDPVFAGLIMGDGLAIEPLSAQLLAPCDGVIAHLARTHHALTLQAANGAEVLIHIGIDTVQLDGRGFLAKVQQGERVRQGQVLIEVDLDLVARYAPSLATMLVIANGDQFVLSNCASGTVVAGQSRFLTLAPATEQAARRAAEASPAPVVSAGDTVSAQTGYSNTAHPATVRHGGGLHARPAALVQSAARAFSAVVEIELNGQRANAKSMVALMGLGVREGDLVQVHVNGVNAVEAAAAVVAALETHSEAGHAAPPAVAATAVNAAAAVGTQPALPDGMIAGVCAAPGLAIGQVVRLDAYEPEVPEQGAGFDAEFECLGQALQTVRGNLADELRHAEQRGAKEEGEILRAHQALADDPELVSVAECHIGNGHSAAFAFRQSVRAQCTVLLGLGNALLAERVGDLKDLERRVLSIMLGETSGVPELPDAAILVAEDLAPSELTRLPRAKVAGILTAAGGATAHVAILARALGIPALVACGPAALALEAGQQVLLDASNGRCDPQPSEDAIAQARRQIAEREQRRNVMLESAAAPALTTDGVAIEVAANIGNEADAREGVRNGADGVGLLRTEFLFIDRNDAPTTEEQRAAYQAVLDVLGERSAIIRTLDIGGDKEVPFLPLPAEPNPALGLRGIRTGFARPEILDAQLKALLTVKPLSRLRILVPMIAEVSELIQLRERIDALADEMGLSERPQLGVMIEVPSAALLADQLARHADFLSIGTNDLTQYTLAMDRCHPGLAARLDGLHPSLLRLIALTVEGARKHGRWVGVCGALASDPDAVPVLVGLGVSELSVSPALVPEIKSCVRALSAEQCRQNAQALLQLDSAPAVRAHLRAVGVES